jgi:hypothetical protein
MLKPLRLFLFLLFSLLLTYCSVTWPTAGDYLQSSDAITGRNSIEVDSMYASGWLLWVEQPVDHFNPEKGYFKQRVWLSHRSEEAPVVLITEGYMAPGNYVSELARLFKGNQVIVEHRYFDQSVPDSLEWKYLTAEQAARDHHRVVELLKTYYKGLWINAGVSKGGQAAMIHRAFFPDDVDITVSYVAPFNLEKEDHRLLDFFKTVGTSAQRNGIFEFQKTALKRKDELMPFFVELAKSHGYTFRMGLDRAFELVVLEYPFSMWQWGGLVNNIPESDSPAEVLFAHLHQGSDFGYFSEQQLADIGPFFYQAYNELGYYPYLATPLKPWLKEIKADTVSNKFMAPEVDYLPFRENVSYDILNRLKISDPRMIVITGQNDPWSATSLDTDGFNNILKIEKPGGNHRTRINNLPDSLRQKVLDQLKIWIED